MNSAATYGIGWSIKQVVVQQIDTAASLAQCLDTTGTIVEVRLGLQRTGITPRPGQTWLADRELGSWTLLALVATAVGAPGPLSGRAVLTAGTATVTSTAVTDTSDIFLTSQADGGTPGWLRVSARVPGASFTITSSSNLDHSTVAWLLT